MNTFTLRNTKKGKIAGYHWPVGEQAAGSGAGSEGGAEVRTGQEAQASQNEAGPDKVVCIVHGIGEFGARYDRVASMFNQAGYPVLSMDLRGHGYSLGKKGQCAPRADVLDDVSALLTYAQLTYPEAKIILYGHSMGGNITLDYRSRGGLNDLPAAYLISAPWIRLVHPIPRPAYHLAKVLSKAAPGLTIGSAIDESVLGNPESVLPYKDEPLVHNRISTLCAVDGFETGNKLEKGTLEDNGRAAQVPTMIMHGGADQICDPAGTRRVVQRLQEAGEAVEYIEWPGIYHEIHNGGPESNGDEVIARMIEFFKTV